MNDSIEHITIPAAEILRGITTQTLARTLADRLDTHETIRDMLPPAARDPGIDVDAALAKLPQIGAVLESGIYAGLTIHDNAPCGLILLHDDEKLTWNGAVEWAKKQRGELPTRFDLLVLYKHLKHEFQQDWYWSAEQSAGGVAYAWFQSFGYGYQINGLKVSQGRARAVRRLPIK